MFKKIILIIAVCLLLFALSRVSISSPTKIEGLNQNEQPQNSSPYQDPKPEDMTLYKNTRLGFSMKIPKIMDCHYNQGVCKVNVYENGIDQLAFVYPEFDFKYNSEEDTYEKVTTTYEQLKKDAHPVWWKLSFATVSSDQDALSFLQNVYGKNCKTLLSKTPATQAGVYDVVLGGNTTDNVDPETDCVLDFVYKIKYFPAEQRIATWNMGQDSRYSFGLGKGFFDTEMADSFQFLKK